MCVCVQKKEKKEDKWELVLERLVLMMAREGEMTDTTGDGNGEDMNNNGDEMNKVMIMEEEVRRNMKRTRELFGSDYGYKDTFASLQTRYEYREMNDVNSTIIVLVPWQASIT